MSKSEPKIVYHYCSEETFYKIINNASLKFSDITKSNDSNEMKFLLNNYERVRPFFESLKGDGYGYLDKALEAIQSPISKIICYTCCFSKEGDLLSQWRGYADDAKGLSIGFKTDVFKELENDGFIFDKVKYKNLPNDIALPEVINIYRDEDSFVEFMFNSIFTKYNDFKEEKEYRLVYPRVIDKNLNGISNIISYDESKCTKEGKEYFFLKIPIEKYIDRIVIGPKCKLTEEDIRKVVTERKIKVKKSKIAYR